MMLFAIENYELGKQREISAEAVIHHSHRHFSSRFICPECNEEVTLVKRTNSAHFKHHNRTDSSPECDKRVDGHSGLTVYERVGLPLYLQKDIGNTFKLYMGFRALGEDILRKAFTNNGRLTISNRDSRRLREYSHKITPTNFYPDQTTLVPIDFFPANGQNYSINYTAGLATSAIEKAWAGNADGFSLGGTIFSYSESGGKKIRHGDSITTNENYYVIAKQFSPYYPEINVKPVGNIYLNDQNLNVYIIQVNVSVQSSKQFQRIDTYLYSIFGVWLLGKKPELITLWPPVIENDGLIPSISSSKIFGSVISGNEIPQVYSYKGATSYPITIHSDLEANHTVTLQMLDAEIVVSVDRKYVGREIIFKRRSVSFTNYKHSIVIRDEKNNVYDGSEALPIQILNNELQLISNTKLELYRKSIDERYQHISIRSPEPISFTNMKKQDTIFAYFESRLLALFFFRDTKIVKPDQDDSILTKELLKCVNGQTVPTPGWIKSYIAYANKCGYHEFSTCLFELASNGQIPIRVLKYIINLKEVFKYG